MIDHSQNTDLFSPVKFGGLELANRIVMAPLTRSRMKEWGAERDARHLLCSACKCRSYH